MDSLTKVPNIMFLYCTNNKIAKLPDLSSLTKFSYLSCGRNLLTSLDLSKNTPLTYLDCSRNLLTTVKGLDKLVNLQTLFVYNNKLDSLPNLSGLTKLKELQCQGNNLKKLPGLGQLTQITQVIAGDNQFDSIPDISALTKLTVLQFYNCRLTSVPNLSNNTSLTHLVLYGNQLKSMPSLSGNPSLIRLELDHNLLTKLPDISANKNTMDILKVHNNQLDTLPDLSSFSTLDTLFVQNNRLTFEDLIPLAQRTAIANLKYAPQDSVGTRQDLFIEEGQSLRIVIGIDKKIADNQYTWYKNGTLYASTTTDTLFISKVQQADSGIFTCQVRNTRAPKLTLLSRLFKVKIKPCIDLSKLIYTTMDYECNVGGSISIKEASIAGGQAPYSYKLVSTELGTIHYPYEGKFSNLFESAYKLEVKDKSGCRSVYSKSIPLNGRKGSDCKRLVILGGDNSSNNTLYLEDRGTAKVYDNEGQLVQTFSTPAAWDGKNKNGDFLPGLYLIDLNGKMLSVTLIK